MALLFAEHSITVLLNDPSESTVDSLLKTAEKDGIRDKLEKHLDYEDLCKNLDSPNVFVFSLPHGTVGDSVVEGLHPYLEKGDLIVVARALSDGETAMEVLVCLKPYIFKLLGLQGRVFEADARRVYVNVSCAVRQQRGQEKVHCASLSVD